VAWSDLNNKEIHGTVCQVLKYMDENKRWADLQKRLSLNRPRGRFAQQCCFRVVPSVPPVDYKFNLQLFRVPSSLHIGWSDIKMHNAIGTPINQCYGDDEMIYVKEHKKEDPLATW
jgi:hypothetical protein